MRPFYITTPIYYLNAEPHIGHAYTTIACDIFARFQRLCGRPVRFQTGTDEHGIKLEQAARERNMQAQAFVDGMAPPFKDCFDQLDCHYQRFIRTTEPEHEARVQAIWQRIKDNGDIYLGEYEGWYSVADEAFITEKELETLDPVTRSKVTKVKEESYFFKLSAYTDKLLEHYEHNPDFVQPAGRFNEVKAFVKEGLRDLSVSRTTFKWGVPVPGDDKHVMYVWLDALSNYVTGLDYPRLEGEESSSDNYDTFWQSDGQRIQVVGKEIIRFHAVYWPAFLMSAGLPLPSNVWAHGWLTVNGQKMSKRFRNFIAPGPLVDAFGADVLRYYLMREVSFGQDGDFSHENLIRRYNGELANGLGNLCNRMVASIIKKSLGCELPIAVDQPSHELDQVLYQKNIDVAERAQKALAEFNPNKALDACFELIGEANRYVDQTEPWALAKTDKARLAEVAYMIVETLGRVSVMLFPFMPTKANGLRKQLGLEAIDKDKCAAQWPDAWGVIKAGHKVVPGAGLFPRIDKDQEAKLLAQLVPAGDEASVDGTGSDGGVGGGDGGRGGGGGGGGDGDGDGGGGGDGDGESTQSFINFDDFMKVELKLGLVLSAEELKKSDKLLRLMIDVGEDKPRQVLAGIRKHYQADDLVGKRVVVASNLKPRKMMGVESQGMVLAASDDDGLSVLTVEKEITPGVRVS